LHQNIFEMRKFLKISIIFGVVLTTFFVVSCNRKLDNQIIINTPINFRIYPNSLEYQDLNVTGGFMYLNGEGDSYGIIVYRSQPEEFRAYDRKPFYNEKCPNNRLYVKLPLIIDECNNYEYLILDGYNVNGDGTHIYWYKTEYDGTELRIYN